MLTNPYYLVPIIVATLVFLFYMFRPLSPSSGDFSGGFEALFRLFHLIPYLLFWIIILGIRSCNAN